MNVNDYLRYSAKITPDGKFFMIEVDGDGWEGALSQGRTLEEAYEMAEALIYDYVEGLIEFKKFIPKPNVIENERYIINVGYDTALKIVLRNLMYEKEVKPAELSRRLHVTPQHMNSILNLRKQTNINQLARCFEALGTELKIEV